jgi:hypothetical protein
MRDIIVAVIRTTDRDVEDFIRKGLKDGYYLTAKSLFGDDIRITIYKTIK